MAQRNLKVAVGMSGGVDSSVAALLLKEKGYEVEGIFMDLKRERNLSETDLKDVSAVARALSVDFSVIDLKKEFSEKVLDYFTEEYLNGRTPNPCVICNREIKFGSMLDSAVEKGFDFFATGHYAKIEFNELTGRYNLKRSASVKDQSYFLYRLTQEQLSKVIFPLSELSKDEIREIARKNNLPVADKGDSQDICFIDGNDYVNFIKEYTGYVFQKGFFVDEGGKILGEHNGIINFTVGQRKGLGGTFGKPMYVTKINAQDNTVTLGEEGSQNVSSLTASRLNWIAFEKPEEPIRGLVKIRNQSRLAEALITPVGEDRIRVDFDAAQRAVTPGQSAVIYDGDTVVGGGIIE